jgi:hypothetical protein
MELRLSQNVKMQVSAIRAAMLGSNRKRFWNSAAQMQISAAGRPKFNKRSRGPRAEIVVKSLVKSLTCRYCNLRDRMVVLRCRDSHHATLERVLFPLQSFQFQFSDQGVAEVWTHGRGGAELLERCPMHELSC